MQCGVACLQMICRFYGKNYSSSFLSEHCHASVDGVSLLGVKEAAEKLGMQTICGKTTLKQLSSASLPCILYWNQNHFVVLYKVKKGKRFYVADPGKGKICYRGKEFNSCWICSSEEGIERGVAMFLYPTDAFYEKSDDIIGEKRSLGFLGKYARQYQGSMAKVIVAAIIGSLLQLIFPFLTQAIVDVGIEQKDLNIILLILLGQLVFTISKACADFFRRRILLRIGTKINISLVSDFFIKLLKLPMYFFDTKLTGDLLQRMNDHKRLETFLTTHLVNLTFSFLTFIIFGMVLLSYNVLILFIFILGCIIYALWTIWFLGRRKVLDYMLFEKEAQNSNKTYQFVTSMQEIKLQDCEQRRRKEWETIQSDLLDIRMKTLNLSQAQEAGAILINETKNILITIIAAMLVIKGSITLGVMLAIHYILGQLDAPLDRLMNFIYNMQDVNISIERINEIRDKTEEEQAGVRMAFTDDGSLRFNHVSFKYDAHSPNKALDDICITIPEGQVTAIVGTSGSGKTTMIKLMLGFYQVTEGDITIGETPIQDYSMKWWRRQCGVVMQEGVIFSESIARNIAVDDNEIDEDRLKRATRIACVDSFVDSLPLKYDTIIGKDGIGLSQGQKQRILIARAVYKEPHYIFLDEATNSLDANNERAIVEKLAEFYNGKTVVIVAHRLSTVRNADQLIVIDNGRIVEQGQHDDLISKRGAYYNLVKNQLELGS